ncbi:nucleolar protein 58-like [Paramacrobiotus metropolitanus]|uniref:nucleolar protein 58-like n=1 Tax=Paramacrobiotus metropolitanus TaxID=2943436 RepID=UPI0024462082|nr:nucleolar protein 58-like [Paramacrobiotus metropolitanus]
MLVLYETATGYAVFKVLDEKKLKKIDNLYDEFQSFDTASSIVQLQKFYKFGTTEDALSAATATVEGKIGKKLKKVLKKIKAEDAHEQLAVADSALGKIIKDKFDITCVANTQISELMRCIRTQTNNLIAEVSERENNAMILGLAHGLSRHTLRFSGDKIDTMIIQAVSLLDDLDKELNNYIMRCREWYGWHFPELGSIIQDHAAYIKTVKKLGMRTATITMDLSDILPADLEQRVKDAGQISMGTEISEQDIEHISSLCDQILEMHEYRAQLYDYLKNRMAAIAPNLTVLLGELVGARLISHAGSLMGLAKYPASTIQILGAEKALFRALKKKHDTPKYGLIYHAQLISQSSPKIKGKMSRMVAAKASLSIRVDALAETDDADLGTMQRAYLEQKAKELESVDASRKGGVSGNKNFDKYQNKSQVWQYQSGNDVTITPQQKIKKEPDFFESPAPGKLKKVFGEEQEAEPNGDAETPSAKKKGKKRKDAEEIEAQPEVDNGEAVVEEPSEDSSGKKKKKKKVKTEEEA